MRLMRRTLNPLSTAATRWWCQSTLRNGHRRQPVGGWRQSVGSETRQSPSLHDR